VLAADECHTAQAECGGRGDRAPKEVGQKFHVLRVY
jgi:hypothetical protein